MAEAVIKIGLVTFLFLIGGLQNFYYSRPVQQTLTHTSLRF